MRFVVSVGTETLKVRAATAQGVRRASLLSLVAAACLFASNASAYRTGGDLQRFKGTERVRWGNNAVTFELAAAHPSNINPFDFSREFVRAQNQWAGPDCGSFRAEFDEVPSGPAKFGDGHNTIQMVSSGWATLGYPDAAAGATDLRYEKQDGEWRIVEADIYINAESFRWTTDAVPSADARTLFSVLFHEGGHALGLLHPCEEDGANSAPQCKASGIAPGDSVMYPVYDASQGALRADDIAGLCFLYPKCESTGCPTGFECRSDGCSQACPTDAATGRCTTDQVCAPKGCISLDECAATNCLKKDSCTSVADCDLGEYCTPEGACKTGERAFGDACSASNECAHSVCVASVCVPACIASADCAPDASCSLDVDTSMPPGRGVCVGPEKPLGQPCTESNECLGGECLAGASEDPVCTRLCGEGEPECPAPWSCSVVKGRSVCTPLDGPAGGCSVTLSAGVPSHNSKALSWLASFGAALTVGFLHRVRRRFSRRATSNLRN